MFNAAYTISAEAPVVVKAIETMLKEKGYKPGKPKTDELDTIRLKAVNKSILGNLRNQLKRTRAIDPEAQRAAIRFSIIPSSEEIVKASNGKLTTADTHLFMSVYPLMEFFVLPEIPGITETEEERATDEKLCMSILDELVAGIRQMFPAAEEHFITHPMRRTYLLPDSRLAFSRDDIESNITGILKHLNFEVVRSHESEFNLTLEIVGVNRSLYHTLEGMVRSRDLSKLFKDTQRVTVRFTIMKPNIGWDHKVQIHVEMFPSMEFFGKEEIQTITQGLDEELADSRLGKELWEPLVKLLDEEYGEYLQE
jgi:hypothetical protein